MNNNRIVNRAVVFSLFLSLFFIIQISAEEEVYFAISHSSGNYASDQLVSITPSDPSVKITYQFSGSRSGNRVMYAVPLHLTALPGENRTYILNVFAEKNGIVVDQKEYTFIIAKSFPEPPSVSPAPGVFHGPVDIIFENKNENTIIYSFDAPPAKQGIEWDGSPVTVPYEKSRVQRSTLFAYSINEYGNKSSIASWNYVIKDTVSPGDEAAFLEVLSPVEGDFANRQLLCIIHEGFDWIRYSIGEGDPAVRGTDYIKPIEIDAAGRVTLRIAGKRTADNAIISKVISFSVTPQASITSSMKNGAYTNPLTVSLQKNDAAIDNIRYVIGDRKVEIHDSVYSGPFTLYPLKGGLKYYTVRFASQKEESLHQTEYRYVAIFDNRIAANPEILLSKPLPLSSSAVITLRGALDTELYYTTDGTSPDKSSSRYKKPFELSFPEETKTGTVTIRARAYTPAGAVSGQATRIIDYDFEPPDIPVVSAEDCEIAIDSSENATIIYELAFDGAEPPAPDQTSPICPDRLTLSLPHGMEREFTLRFAAVDAAGNISDASETKTFTIDNHPPPPPAVEFDSGFLRMRGEGTIFYTLSENNTLPAVPGKTSETYSRPISLSGVADALSVYQINAVAVDEHGNRSSISGPHVFSVDRRDPELPVVRGIENNGLCNSQHVTVTIENIEPKLAVVYSFTTDGSEPLDPDFTFPRIENTVTFPGIEGERTVFRLKLRPVYFEGNRAGEVEEFTFTIDLDPPEPPHPVGFENGSVYNRKVTVSFENPNKEDTIYYSAAETEDALPDPFSDFGRLYCGKLFFDSGYNQERTFFLRFGSADSAGNQTLNPELYHFTVDRLPPEPPVLGEGSEEGIKNKPVEVELVSEGNTIYYSTHRSSSREKNRGAHSDVQGFSTEYEEPFTISGEMNKEITYYVHAVSVDNAGNQCQNPSIFQFTIDRKSPQFLPEPDITVLENRKRAVLSWDMVPDNSIFYRIRTQSRIDVASFKQYTKPLQIDFSGDTRFGVEYYIEDNAGNRSSVEIHEFNQSELPSGNYITGIHDKKMYNDDVIVKNNAGNGIVRYEVAAGGVTPQPVTRFSPVLPEEYVFKASEGEQADFAMNTRMYKNSEDEIGENDQSFQFSIDKDPPPGPIITGVEQDEYFQKNCTITISAKEGTIFYNLEHNTTGSAETQHTDFTQYSGPIEITAEAGTYNTYSITAYTEDKAGNTSPPTQYITFYIDREVIYVSKESGSDYFNGSRERPFKTLEKAVKEVQSTSRKTIFLTGEEYYIDTPITLDFDVMIRGGFDPDDWQRSSDSPAVIKPGKYFSTGSPLITVSHAEIDIADVSFADPDTLTRFLIRQKSGTLLLSDIKLLPSPSYNHPLFYQDNGTVTITDCYFHFDTVSLPNVLTAKGNSFTINRSTIGFNESKDDISLLFFEHVPNVVISECTFLPGSGKRIYGIDVIDSGLSLTDSSVQTGNSEIRSVGINMKDSSVVIDKTEFIGNEESRLTFCIQGERSNLELIRTKISAVGKRGATGLYVKESSVDARDCTFLTGNCEEFSYCMKVHESTGAFFNNNFFAYHTNDLIGVEITASEIQFMHNSIVVEESDNVSIGVLIQQSPATKIINNILCKKQSDKKQVIPERNNYREIAALKIEGAMPSHIISNNVGGWETCADINGTLYDDITGFNLSDGEPLSGPLSGNIAEPVRETFTETKFGALRIKESSRCVDAGMDTIPLRGPEFDRDGEKRPNPNHGDPPAADIGSDEYYSDSSP